MLLADLEKARVIIPFQLPAAPIVRDRELINDIAEIMRYLSRRPWLPVTLPSSSRFRKLQADPNFRKGEGKGGVNAKM